MTDDREPLTLRDASEIPGVPDAFQRLWVPHRIAYLQGTSPDRQSPECVFCAAPAQPDAESLVVFRGRSAYVVLNLYPYNPGHLLVCPYRHIPTYDEATEEETAEIARMTQVAMRLIRKISGAHGFNIGMNQGRVAGAGIEEHLHQHVVPRWSQDSNFFPIIARTKAMPQTLGDVRDQLREAWSQEPLG